MVFSKALVKRFVEDYRVFVPKLLDCVCAVRYYGMGEVIDGAKIDMRGVYYEDGHEENDILRVFTLHEDNRGTIKMFIDASSF